MPASTAEVTDIVRIMSRYLPLDKARELARELKDEIGIRTNNESLRITLALLVDVLDNHSAQIFRGHTPPYSIKPGGLRTYGDELR